MLVARGRQQSTLAREIGRRLGWMLLGALSALLMVPIIVWFRIDLAASEPSWSSFCVQRWPELSNEVTGGMLPPSAEFVGPAIDNSIRYLTSRRADQFPREVRDELEVLRAQALRGGLSELRRRADESRYVWNQVNLEYENDICVRRRSSAS